MATPEQRKQMLEELKKRFGGEGRGPTIYIMPYSVWLRMWTSNQQRLYRYMWE